MRPTPIDSLAPTEFSVLLRLPATIAMLIAEFAGLHHDNEGVEAEVAALALKRRRPILMSARRRPSSAGHRPESPTSDLSVSADEASKLAEISVATTVTRSRHISRSRAAWVTFPQVSRHAGTPRLWIARGGRTGNTGLGRDTETITPVVKRMERAGLVRR